MNVIVHPFHFIERSPSMLTIDKYSRVPIYEQIIEQVEMHIALGDMLPESLLPSVRNLSVSLSVNPNTLQKAYTELERRGLCYTVPGNGRFISPDATDKLRTSRQTLLLDIADKTTQLAQAGIPLNDIVTTVTSAYQEATQGGAS